MRVIGVTEDVASGNIFEGIDASCVYFPTDAQPLTDMSLLVRARTDDVEVLRSAVTTAVKEVAPETSFQVFPMRTLVGLAAWIFQAFSVAASILSLVGLLFAYSGTHAVVSFLVAQRTREFGVRMALGASAWRIVWGMLVETSRTALIGLAAGLAVAAGLIRLFSGSSRDPAGLRCPSFRGGRRDRARRDGRGRAVATAPCRADRSCASASSGVTSGDDA